MAMNFDKLTVKAQEAVQESQREAENRSHQSIEVEHLLTALLNQEGGVVLPIIEKVGVDQGGIVNRLEEALSKFPKVEGLAQVYWPPLKQALQYGTERG